MTTDHSPFFNLPLELRTIIYEYAIGVPRVFRAGETKSKPPAMLTVNKQIYVEATPIFYASTTFEIWHEQECWMPWLSKMPKLHRNAIKHLRNMLPFEETDRVDRMDWWFKHYSMALMHRGINLKEGMLWFGVLVKDKMIWHNKLGQLETEDNSVQCSEYIGGLELLMPLSEHVGTAWISEED